MADQSHGEVMGIFAKLSFHRGLGGMCKHRVLPRVEGGTSTSKKSTFLAKGGPFEPIDPRAYCIPLLQITSAVESIKGPACSLSHVYNNYK